MPNGIKKKIALIFLFLVFLTSLNFAAWNATGGTKTNFTNTSGLWMVHTFTANGTFIVYSVGGAPNISILTVAGGGGGGSEPGCGGASGGGGAGGLKFNNTNISLGSYAITVGNGGDVASACPQSTHSGQPSNFSNIFNTTGGGAGGIITCGAASGGSGGGGTFWQVAGGTGTALQGNNGGNGVFTDPPVAAGGGGGAGAVGQIGQADGGGNGGAGLAYNITGTLTNYSCGGGGGAQAGADRYGVGGCNFGGNASPTGTNGVANTGSGGGGGTTGGYGGSGIVIISYLAIPTCLQPSINYSFKDSTTYLPVNSSYVNIYSTSSSENSGTLTGTNTNYLVCLTETNTSYAMTTTEAYIASGYGNVFTSRSINASNITQQITIYLNNLSLGSYYSLRVQNIYSSDISGANIVGYNLLANGSYVQFQNSTTDSTGSAVFFLLTTNIYNFSISAAGYNSIQFNLIPASATTILIQLTQNSTLNLTKFNVWNDTQYYISPPSGYYNSSQLLNFTVVSTSSNLSSWGLNLVKNNASGSFWIFNNSNTTTAGGSSLFNMTPNATYIAYAWFQKSGNANYTLQPVFYYITNQTTGLALITNQMKGGAFLSGWTFYFIALFFAVGTGMYLFQFGSGASALGGLAVLCFFTYLAPSDMYLFGNIVTPLVATITISIAVLAALYSTTYGV